MTYFYSQYYFRQKMNGSANICSEIENEGSPPPPRLTTLKAPNRLLNLETIKKTIDPHLLPCPVCSTGRATVSDGVMNGFQHNLIIECDTCNKEDESLRRQINRIKRCQLENNKRGDANKIRSRLSNAKRKLRKLRTERMDLTNRDYQCESNKAKKETEENLRAIFASFYVGTGGQDVGSILTFLGVPGGHSWHNIFHKNSETVNRRIIELCEVIVEEGLKMEIRAEIEAKLKGKYTSDEIDVYIQNFINDEPDIPDDIL